MFLRVELKIGSIDSGNEWHVAEQSTSHCQNHWRTMRGIRFFKTKKASSGVIYQ